MSTVIGNLLNRLSRPTPIPTTIVLGLQYSGQTAFVYFLKSRQIVPNVSGIGFSMETVQVPTSSGSMFKMTAWHIGIGCDGPELATLYLKVSDAIIWLVDSNDRERLQESVDLLRNLRPHGIENAPILVLTTNSDKPNSLSAEELRIAFSRATAVLIFDRVGSPKPLTGLKRSAKSTKEGEPAAPEKPDLQAKLRSPNDLAQKLESWLTRIENFK